MFEELFERALNCFNKMAPDKSEIGISEPKNVVLTLDASALPDRKQLDKAFRDFVTELDLSPDKQQMLYNQPEEKKWMMVMEQNMRKDKTASTESCEYFVDLLQRYDSTFPETYDIPKAIQQLDGLAISLRTNSHSYVQKFLHLGGLERMISVLDRCRERSDRDHIALPLLNSFRALLNSSDGRSVFLDSPKALQSVAAALDLQNSRCKIVTLEILSALCVLSDQGHTEVIRALSEVSPLLGERRRFQKLVDDLHRPRSSERESERVRTAVMCLINALLKSGVSEHSLEFRLHLRYELLMLGVQDVIDRLRDSHGSALQDHFDLFEMMRQEDEMEMSSSVDSGSSSPVDFENPAGMAEALTAKLNNTVALPHFISLLQHMLMIPGDEKHVHMWRLFDMLIQQLSLQVTMGQMSADMEPSLVKIDIQQALSRLRTQHEYEQLEKELAETNDELELERKRVIELENRVSDLQDDAFSRISDFSSSPSDPCHSPTPTILSTSTSSLPPVKPPTSGPPPPPPSAAQLKLLGGSISSLNVPQKNVPKPSATLRTLNWSVLPANKISSTVWEKIGDEKVYKNLDLEDLATNFVAGKGHQDDNESIYGTLQRKMRSDTLVSVIDAQRSQNCTIMLSKLKLTNREIRTAMLTMDEKGKIPKDMIEQMLKYVPSREEMTLLKEAVEKYKSPAVLAIADRFLLEVGQIPRYEQRLKCLHIMRTYKERVDELVPCINAVIKASNSVSSNKKLKQLLSIILAIGNFLNYGKKSGNASGFAVTSLNAVAGVKSAMRCDRNLMHYIIGVVEEKYPELLRMQREMTGIFDAARCSRPEMEQEMRQVEASLRVLSAELRVQEKILEEEEQELKENIENLENNNNAEEPRLKRRRTVKGDKFIKIVRAFLADSKTQYKEMEALHAEMNSKFFACVRYFAADGPGCSPDDFFGIFAKFLNTFSECRQQLWDEKEEIERVKKQTLARSVFAKRGGRRRQQKNSDQDFEKLISALQSGEIFSEDLCRLRSSFRVSPRKKILVQ
ncbi:hypothetical protein QR680_006862 [Steinernema hermaphroditum]|uniref:FH2 domain-containing protein n=1 Tax=Steinernema hermaphroditum TaxID=289476 RepID=A0AA39HWT2_9BILA|nr:hypothetical protein QR680_006862 [Steinernema hermaphroditum]